MTFPETQSLITVEISPDADLSANPSTWTWVDITSFLRADPIIISGGQSGEGSESEPVSCSLVLDNTDGRFSARNVVGPWFGQLRTNTPIRIYWDAPDNPRINGFVSEWPPHWDISGDDATAPIEANGLLRRLGQGVAALRSAAFRSLSNNPNVVAYWPCEENSGATQASSPIAGVNPWRMPADYGAVDGPPGSDQLALSAEGSSAKPAPVPNHTPGDVYVVEQAWRIDEDESAGRHLLHVFTTSTTLAHWLIYIDDTNFGVRAWDGDDVLVVDATQALDHSLFGQWLRVELRFRDFSGSSTAWEASITVADADAAELNRITGVEISLVKGRVTKVGSDGGVSSQDRYFGHLAVLTGTTVELPDTADMGTLVSTDRHAPYHGWTGELAADRFERLCSEEELTCTVLAPTGGLGLPGTSGANASTPDAAALDITGDIDVRGWLAASDWTSGLLRQIASKYQTTGDQRSWAFLVGVSGELGFSWTTAGTVASLLEVSMPNPLAPMPPDNGLLAVRATLDVNNGAAGHDVAFYTGPSLDGPWVQVYSETNSGTTSIFSGSAPLLVGDGGFSSAIAGAVRAVRVYNGIGGTLVADPDFTTQAVGAATFDDDAGNTWTINGDAAIVRADDTMPMGPQQIDTLVANFRDCQTADGGILGEAGFGLFYRTRTDLYRQSVKMTLDVDNGELALSPQPTDDDRHLSNDVTASQPKGTSARVVDQQHVVRHGRYENSVEINVAHGDLLLQSAAWLVHLGTVDEMRWPQLSIDLATKPHLMDAWLAGRLGDRLRILHAVSQIAGVDVDLLVVGYSEQLTTFGWDVTLNCVPASPYDVAVFGAARFDTAGSTTSGGFVAGTGTSLTVVTAAGSRPWVNSTDHAAEFPLHIKVSGVVLNVTAISGSTSPQTLTVDATTVNGVEKTIPSGSAVALADTPAFAL
jgi:hypothetical protein